MKHTAPATEKALGKDLKPVEQLPARTKELELLQHQAEKATGQESVALDTEIRDKAKPAASGLPRWRSPIPLQREVLTSQNWKQV